MKQRILPLFILIQKLYQAALNETNCENVNCLRELTVWEIRELSKQVLATDHHPAAPRVQTFITVIDGQFILNELFDAVRTGHVRPNTPIVWNYAEHELDGWAYPGFSSVIRKVPALVAQLDDIWATISSSSFKIPSDYTDQYLEELVGMEHLSEILDVFGCSSTNGEIIDCAKPFGHYVTASGAVCNTRRAFKDMHQVNLFVMNRIVQA